MRLSAFRNQTGFALRGEHEFIEGKIAKRQGHDHNDHPVHPSPGLRSDRLLRRHISLAPQALGRYFENPAKDRRRDETDREQNDDDARQPLGRPKHWQYRPGHLHRQPRTDEIEPHHADDIAPLQFGEEVMGLHRATL